MALWFHIKVNDTPISLVYVQRVLTEPSGVHSYDWAVYPRTEVPDSAEATVKGVLTHREEEGAEKLSWLVLGAYLDRVREAEKMVT